MLASINDINKGFNKEQIEAVKEINGYIFNSAPPGSGKTFVLENRILWMAVEHQIPTRNILALTFTNEAAKEMRDRISDRLEEFNIENNVTALTFHSFAHKIIRTFGNSIIPRYFTLLDDTDRLKIISSIIKKQNKDDDNTEMNRNLTKEYSEIISSFKSKGITVNELFKKLKESKEQLDKYEQDNNLLIEDGYELEDLNSLRMEHNIKVDKYSVYREYEVAKKEFSKDKKSPMLYDFDDLMINLKLLLTITSIRKKISEMYVYILCDESQDIDEVQRDILLLLSKDNGNLFCIFDDDQSIYSFRNADPNLILSLPELVKNPKQITLSENFRSTRNIIEAANHLISNNRFRIPKWMTTNNQDGEKVCYKCLQSKEAEANFICEQIKYLMEEYKFDYKDFGILYRNNDLNKVVEQKLLKNKIPYRINRNISFFQRKEIKDILAYLEVAINDNTFYLDRIYKVPTRGIGEKTYLELKNKAVNCGMSIFEVLESETKSKLKDFSDLLTGLRNNSNKPFSVLIDLILELTDYYKKEFKESEIETRKNSIELLKIMLSDLEKLFDNDKKESLIQLKILSGDDEDGDYKNDKVNLMTIHSSKGKGFKVVFVIGCEQNIIPSFAAQTEQEIEEERRLFYVAITRAKLFCYLTRSKYRLDRNNNLKETEISQFVEEIPDEYLSFDEDEIF